MHIRLMVAIYVIATIFALSMVGVAVKGCVIHQQGVMVIEMATMNPYGNR